MPDANRLTHEPQPTPPSVRRFGALGYPEFRLLWFGLAISNTGSWMATLAQGWLVVELAPRPALAPLYLGIIGFVRSVPVVLLSGVAGAIADRVDRRRLLVFSQLTLGLSALTLAILAQTHVVQIWQVVVLAGISAVGLTFDAPTRQSLVPLLVGPGELMNAIGLNSAAFNGPGIIGPAIGGILVSTVGVADTFYLNALSYAAVLAALALMTPKPPLPMPERQGIWHEVMAGLRYVREQPAILTLLSLALLVSIVARPYIQLLPAFVKATIAGGPGELGVLMAASGAGALAGSIATAFIGNRRHRGSVSILSAAFAGVFLFAFSRTHTVVLGVITLIALAFFVMLFMGMTNTLLQYHTALAMRGRVMALYTMIFLGFMPFGAWLLGTTATFTSLPLTLSVAGILVAFAAVVVSRIPGPRDLA
ncbi:MAG: MFS transporter [Candidatus Eremiobacteraeota bacterium]|nr:MFS transporter [Candidatus Eremiobacteraeota bacterium]